MGTIVVVERPTQHTSSSLRVALLLTAGNGLLDVYTLVLHGVFATAQTGNVVLLFGSIVRPITSDPLDHLWPILAFMVGVLSANLMRSPPLSGWLRFPVRFALGLQVVLLLVVALLPPGAPALASTLLISAGAGLQLGLFRLARSNAYITIATTGNLLRLTESAVAAVRTRRSEDAALVRFYLAIVAAFIVGAMAGAMLVYLCGRFAIWFVIGLVSLALAMFFVDDRREQRLARHAPTVEDQLTD